MPGEGEGGNPKHNAKVNMRKATANCGAIKDEERAKHKSEARMCLALS